PAGRGLHPPRPHEPPPHRRDRLRLLLSRRDPDLRGGVREGAVRHRPAAREPPPARGRGRRRGRSRLRRRARRLATPTRPAEREDLHRGHRRGRHGRPLHPCAPHAQRVHGPPLPRRRGAVPHAPEPDDRGVAARHHAAVPLGPGRGGADDAPLARDGARAAPLRRGLGQRLRRRPRGTAVDVRRDARPARGERLAAPQGAADVPAGRRDRRRGRRRLGLPSTYRDPIQMSTGNTFLVLSAFLASAVEFVEALTIVLASALARGWRSSLAGVGAATVVLAGCVAALGPALTAIPLNALRLAVGALLLVFGLQWLRKAILRASGYKALHDEDEIFARELADAQGAGHVERAGLDWYGFVLSFKGVLLEGLEVVFIVLTFGSAQHSIPLAAVGAGGALVLVAGVGIAVRAPLARVPENLMKFAVGVMLTTFGIFWSTEGAGAHWPG